MLTYPVGFLGAKKRGPLTASRVGGAANNGSYSVNLGAGASDLFVCVAVADYAVIGVSAPTSVTVGGVSLTKVADANFSGYNGFNPSLWFGHVPAGGSQTVSFAPGSGTQYYASDVFVIRGSSNTTFDTSASGHDTGSVSLSINLSAGEVLIGAYAGYAAATLTGLTSDGSQALWDGNYTTVGHFATSVIKNGYSTTASNVGGLTFVEASFKP